MPEKRKSAFLRATQEAQQPQTTPTIEKVIPQHSETVIPSNLSTVAPLHTDTALPHENAAEKKESKTTFYLTIGQIRKLKELEYTYWQRTGKSANRNDLVRHLIDHCTIESFKDL